MDHLYFFLTVITLFFTILIFGTIFFFMIKYRRRSPDEIPPDTKTHLALELTWTIIPTMITRRHFSCGRPACTSKIRGRPKPPRKYSSSASSGCGTSSIPKGVREINELHVPVNVPIKLTMTSDDVIHDFYIPAFRVKKDAVPGRYTSLWFQATKIGTYHIFCAQYCGADHAEMIGWVYVMSAPDYAAWLSGGIEKRIDGADGRAALHATGLRHLPRGGGTGRGPSLAGLYGKPEKLRSGDMRVVDETLIRQAIVNPNSILLPNYPPIMPTFQGQINEEQVLQLIAYVKSLGPEERKTNAK